MSNEICTRCGAQLYPNAKFCPRCGAPAPAQQPGTCPNCGRPVSAGLRFCTGCGTELRAKSAPAAAPQRPVAQQGAVVSPSQRPMNQQQGTVVPPSQRPMTQQQGAAVPPSQRPMTQQPVQAAPRPMVCPSCGNLVEPGKNFCTKCGNRIVGAPAAPVQQPRPMEAAPVEEQPKKKHTGLIIGIIAAVLLLAAAAVLFIFRDQIFGGDSGEDKDDDRREKTAVQADSVDASASNTPEAEPSDDSEQEQISVEEARTIAEETIREEYPDKEFTLRPLSDSAESVYYIFEVLTPDGVHLGEIRIFKDGTGYAMQGIEWPEPAVSKVHEIDSDYVDSLMSRNAGNAEYSFAVVDAANGELEGSSNAENQMSSSVLIGIPIMYAVEKDIEENRLNLDEMVPVVATQGSRGSLYGYTSMSVGDLLNYMLRNSSGDAINSLMDYMGIDHINDVCHADGFTSVELVAHIGQTEDYVSGRDNFVSSQDLARILYTLYSNPKTGYGYVNESFLRSNFGIQGNLSNSGLGKNLSGVIGSFNGVKAKKFNELLLVDHGDGRVYIVAMMANGADYDKNLLPGFTEVGSYIDGVMTN